MKAPVPSRINEMIAAEKPCNHYGKARNHYGSPVITMEQPRSGGIG